MEWWALLVIFLGALILLLFMGVPVAFAFGILNIVMLFFFVGEIGAMGPFLAVARSCFRSIATFSFVAVPLFIFLGDLLLRSGVASKAIDGLIMSLTGRTRGTLFYTAIIASLFFGAVSGSSMASTATIGSSILPEGVKRGYNNSLLSGAIVCGGNLALLIPPSIFMVVFGGIARLSVGKLLIGGLGPGIVIGILFLIFLVILVKLKPEFAPTEEVITHSIKKRIRVLFVDVVPLLAIFFTIVIIIYRGIGTPTEAAAGGVVAALILVAAYRKLSWLSLHLALMSTTRITGMVFLIIAGAITFSQILAWTGTSAGLVNFMVSLPLPSIALQIMLQLLLVAMGCLMEGISILFVTVPLYYPLVAAFGWDPIWWGIMMVMAVALGGGTPPFGLNLFVLKGVAPSEVALSDIYRGAIPFAVLHTIGIILVIFFPQIAMWLPNMMG